MAYVVRSWGGAAQYTKKPRKQEKPYLIQETMRNGNHFLCDNLAFLEIMFYNMFVSFKTSVCIKEHFLRRDLDEVTWLY